MFKSSVLNKGGFFEAVVPFTDSLEDPLLGDSLVVAQNIKGFMCLYVTGLKAESFEDTLDNFIMKQKEYFDIQDKFEILFVLLGGENEN